MEECCDICGDIGVAEALMTCSQCKRNTEHMYCMRICLEVRVDDWRCEECSEPPSSCLLEELTDAPKINSSEVHKGGELHAESRKLPNKSRVGAGDWEKKVPTGKTRYICVTDAIKLSSGEKKSFPSPSPKERRKSGMGKFDAAVRRRTSLPIFSSHQNLASGPLRSRKTQRPGNMEIHKKHMQQSKKLTGDKSYTNYFISRRNKDYAAFFDRNTSSQCFLEKLRGEAGVVDGVQRFNVKKFINCVIKRHTST